MLFVLLAPLSLSGAIDEDDEEDEVMPRSPMDDGGVNASTLLLLVATKRAKITERSVLVILNNNYVKYCSDDSCAVCPDTIRAEDMVTM